MEMPEIPHCRRHHARSAIGGRGDDTAAGRVLFVHGHGIDAQPVIRHDGIQPVATPFRIQFFIDRTGTATHLEAAGHDAVHLQPALDTSVHRVPNLVQPFIQLFARNNRLLVRPFHLGDGAAGPRGHFQHFLRRGERIGHARAVIDGLAALLDRLQFRVGDDKATADGIIDALDQQPALVIESGEGHAVRMARQRVLLVEDEIFGRLELVGRMAGRRNRTGLLHRLYDGVHRVGIDKVRPLAGQAENDCPAGAMTNAGEGERPVQADLQARNDGTGGARPLVAEDQRQKAVGRRHRSHRMRTGRADTDLEDVKDRKKH